jgi:SAM-dependent methyltransferase
MSSENNKYKKIVAHYEDCFSKHGDNHLGMDWPNETDALTRYKVMLDVIPFNNKEKTDNPVSLLDFGCGTAHLYSYILDNKLNNIHYSGLDISETFINTSKNKFPNIDFYCADILDPSNKIPTFDYIVLNGVFTEKRELSFDEMFDYFTKTIKAVYPYANKGIAFNVMSKAVDWERDDLFHLSYDTLADFLTKTFGRTFIFRNDYKLFEYTTYIYK